MVSPKAIATISLLCIFFVMIESAEDAIDSAVEERRKKRRRRPFSQLLHPIAAWTGVAGLIALKIKVTVVVITVVATLFFVKMFIGINFSRFLWGSTCKSEIIETSPPAYHYSEYGPPSYHDFDHVPSYKEIDTYGPPKDSSRRKYTLYSTNIKTNQDLKGV